MQRSCPRGVSPFHQAELVVGPLGGELVGNANGQNNSNEAKTVNSEAHDFGNQCYDIELAGWNDGVYSVYIIAEDTDFLYYYQYSDKVNSIYGMIGRKYITSVLPVNGKKMEKPYIKEISRDFFAANQLR